MAFLSVLFVVLGSTVGRDEKTIREYIRHQEAEDRRVDQLCFT